MKVHARVATPLFRPELRRAPAHPLGNRILIREFPVPDTTEGGLVIAETAQHRCFAGELIAAGDQAADKLYDLGVEIGDEIWYAKYAGVVEEWQRIVRSGNRSCEHDGAWDRIPVDDRTWQAASLKPNANVTLKECRTCKALKASERVLVMSADDVILDVDLQVRFERGEISRIRATDTEGRTRYILKRSEGVPDSLEIGPDHGVPQGIEKVDLSAPGTVIKIKEAS